MPYVPPEGYEIDHEKVGKKGYPIHWEAIGREPPLKPIAKPEAPEPEPEAPSQG